MKDCYMKLWHCAKGTQMCLDCKELQHELRIEIHQRTQKKWDYCVLGSDCEECMIKLGFNRYNRAKIGKASFASMASAILNYVKQLPKKEPGNAI